MANGPLSPGDPHSFSRPDDVAVSHMHLSLEVDFERNTLSGFVDLTVDRKLKKATTLILDSRDEKILQIIDQKTGISLDYSVDKPILSFGSKLSISLPKVPNDSVIFSPKFGYPHQVRNISFGGISPVAKTGANLWEETSLSLQPVPGNYRAMTDLRGWECTNTLHSCERLVNFGGGSWGKVLTFKT
uniref:Uncharacterized protein n=1 Tax=Timema douglasi TaxID=61478 RepID=A0A7R8Z4F1_TIMDO|nr:unnamed protein product [Timema douglasi]